MSVSVCLCVCRFIFDSMRYLSSRFSLKIGIAQFQLCVSFKNQDEVNSLSVANVNMRTTSSLESFNSALNRSIPKKANFFTFVQRLKLHESRKADQMSNIINDKLPQNHFERKHYCDRKREEKIRLHSERLYNGQTNTCGFLAAITDESGEINVQRFLK